MDSSADFDPIISNAEQLCNHGLYLQVQPLLEQLAQHPSSYGKVLSIRATEHLGARRSAESRIFRLWRANRNDPWITTAYLRAQCYRYGPHKVWRQFDRYLTDIDATNECLADRYSLKAYILGSLRDFETAKSAYDHARELAPKTPWPLVEWAYVCEMADRYDEAIAVSEEALDLLPGYRPAIQAQAHLLPLIGRDADALTLLRQTTETTESGSVQAQLLELEIEQGLYEAAWETLDRCTNLYPLRDKALTAWLAAMRTDVALQLGLTEEAACNARAVGNDFYRRIAERVVKDECRTSRRVLLPVGFVRQHFKTCAPATLSALSQYWNYQADHMEIAEEICYDGTPNQSERTWAEDRGFVVREFTVDWGTTRSLIDVGIPFTLTTTWPGGAHLQAVIGYDEFRNTLLIRDPFKRLHGEFDAESLFESHKATGPRGMILVPQSEASRIDGIDLPDAPIWDDYHYVMTALTRHDRQAALARTREMEISHAEHRLTLAARRVLAMYDGDEAGVLSVTEKLLANFPADINLQLSKSASLNVLAGRRQQLEWLAGLAEKAHAEPLAVVRYAQLLGQDGRHAHLAMKMLRRVLDRMPSDASAWYAHAHILWEQGQKEDSIAHYRIASCLSDTDENHAVAYFRAAHALRRSEIGLNFLRQRADRLGHRSSAPLITLFNQYETLERTEEAFILLDQALTKHPNDADLLMFAAEVHLRYAKVAETSNLLDRAEGRAKRAPWLRLKAQLARGDGEFSRALSLAREASNLEPLNLLHHRLVAQMLARHESRTHAISYLRETTARFDHHFGLHQLLVEWLNEDGPSAVEPVLRHLLTINPSSAWAQRELAINLARQHRHEEAWAQMATVTEMTANDSYTHSTLGFIRLHQGRTSEAKHHLREALILSVDNDYALNALVDSSLTLTERHEALAFIRQELTRQVTLGDSLLSFQGAAQRTLPPEEVLTVLREAFDERPDLWQSWVALGVQLIEMGRLNEALEFIARAIDRFPLLPRLRVEHGRALALLGELDAARESYKLALQISPQWSHAVRLYVNTVENEGRDFHRALGVLDAALSRNPEDADLRGLKAWILWRSDLRQEATAEMPRALALDPRSSWMWNTLKHFADELGDPEMPRRIAAELIEKRPGDIWSWIRFAEYATDSDEALRAVDHALTLEPLSEDAYEVRLRLLMRTRRFTDIESALAKHPWEGAAPASIRAFGARVSKAKGDTRAAFEQLKELVDEDPNNYVLWELLADWSDEENHSKSYVEAAEHLVRLAPNYNKAHGFLAHALMKQDQRELATQHFERAFQLDPTYSFAGLNLADIYLDDNNPTKAAAVLEILNRQTRNVFVSVREIRLHVLNGHQERAVGLLQDVFRSTENDWPAKTVIDTFRKADWKECLETQIEACFSTGPCSAAALQFWIEQQERGLIPGSFRRNIKRGLANDSCHTLMRGLLDYAGTHSDSSLLNWLLSNYKDVLTADTDCWSLVSYCLVRINQHAKTVSWMADWRSRAEAPAWALDNLALSLRTLGRHTAARDVTLRSLELVPSNMDAKTWLAVDAARSNRVNELSELLTEIDSTNMRTYYKNLLALLRAYYLGASSGDSVKTLYGFSELREERKQSIVLQDLKKTLSRLMVRHYTRSWLRPIRWLQFALA